MSFSTALDFKKGLRRFGVFLGVGYMALTGGGGCNLFTDFSNTQSDQAILDNAINQIDAKQWTAAIATINTVTSPTLALPSTQTLLATAYAGRGGLDLLKLSQSLQNMGSLTIFQFLLQQFVGSTASNMSDEETAENIMLGISVPAAGRTTDQNVFMIFVELAKLGTILSVDADPLALGTADPGFQSCTSVPAADAAEVVTAVGNLIASVQASGSTVGGSSISSLTADCAALGGVCGVYQVGNVTPLEIEFGQTLVGETALSIGLAIPSETGICEIPPAGNNCLGSGTGLCP